MAERVGGPASEYFTDLEMACRLRSFAEFARDGPCAALAGALMGSQRVCFFYDQYFQQTWRAPGGSQQAAGLRTPHTPWHQDQPYWHVTGSQVSSVWVPLDAQPPGAQVHYIAGSHTWREHSPFHFATGEQYQGTGQPPLPDIDKGLRDGTLQSLSWDVQPGDAIVFSAMAVHGQVAPDSEDHAQRRSCCAGGDSGDEGVDGSGGGRGGAGPEAAGTHRLFRRLALRFTGDDARYTERSGEAKDVIPSKFFPCSLAPGDALECERFPLVWTRHH
eukprot:Tamp_22128.p1 GENE.Tamp_22128~~Tamp_22128.p1  ORF type:complete len:316 (+),score=59.05 Tamp_22128:129-950(+)